MSSATDAVAGRSELILHLVPADIARGAQSYARALADHLDSARQAHRVVSLFRSGPSSARPEYQLDVPMGLLRRVGLHPVVVQRLRRLLRETNPSVVVAHGGEAAKYAAVAKHASTPMIYLMIGTSHPKLGRAASKWLYQMALKRSASVVTVSKALAAEAETLHEVPASRIVAIPNGRDETVFVPSAHDPSSPVTIAWVGNMDDAKRPVTFIELVSEVRSAADVGAWMAGTGPLFAEVKQLGATAGVEVLGERSDVADLLGKSDLLVFTGRPPEGLPGVLIEAAMCGLAVVTTAVPGASEVVEDGVTGYVVDVNDREGLIQAVRDLVLDRELVARMGRRARERAVEHFSLAGTLETWRSVIEGVQAT